jgi:hypothetical protein
MKGEGGWNYHFLCSLCKHKTAVRIRVTLMLIRIRSRFIFLFRPDPDLISHFVDSYADLAFYAVPDPYQSDANLQHWYLINPSWINGKLDGSRVSLHGSIDGSVANLCSFK